MKGTGILKTGPEVFYLYTSDSSCDIISSSNLYFPNNLGSQLGVRDYLKKERIVLPLELAL